MAERWQGWRAFLQGSRTTNDCLPLLCPFPFTNAPHLEGSARPAASSTTSRAARNIVLHRLGSAAAGKYAAERLEGDCRAENSAQPAEGSCFGRAQQITTGAWRLRSACKAGVARLQSVMSREGFVVF